MNIRNPKQDATLLYDCVPQTGKCPNNCNQCYFNREGAFFVDTSKEPFLPDPYDLPEGAVVRINSGHDSNIQKDLVIETAKQYQDYFFNTSLPNIDFPAPVVLTINREEEKPCLKPMDVRGDKNKLMFVRIRVSSTNQEIVRAGVRLWTHYGIPIMLTFMRYYTEPPDRENYEFRKSILNEYMCPKPEFVREYMRDIISLSLHRRLIYMCGHPESSLCKNCLNCYTFYWQTKNRLSY